MTDLFDDMTADEFALPGDDALIARIDASAPADAEADEPAPEAPEEPAAAERPRDEQGRFTKEQPQEGDEDAADAAPVDETAAEGAERLLAGNFKNVDDLERAYEDLRSRFGQQGNELGEIRRAFEERFQQLDQRLATPAAAPVQITTDLIDTNPGYATALAYEQGNQQALGIAYEAWKVEDPAGAGAWLATKQTEQVLAQQRQEYEQRIAQLEARIQPAAEVAEQQQLGALVAAAAAKNPGLADFVQSDAIDAVAAEIPEFGQMLASGTPDQKVRAITALFDVHRGRESDNLRVTQQEVARTTAEQAQQAREEAFVASASTSSTGTKPSKADQIAAEWDDMRRPFDDGWNV